ncbi:MAG: hypothetical protein ACYC43_06525, partial [Burkholderiales bacterium]
LLAALVLLSLMIVAGGNIPVLSVVGTFGTFTGLAFLLIYSLANIATPLFLFRQNHASRWVSLLISAISLPLLLKVMEVSLNPLPGGGEGIATQLFVVLVLIVSGWGLIWARYKPERLREIMRLVDEA